MAHAVRTAHGRPGRPVTKEARMDLWYELAIREMGDLNGEVTEMLKDAETALLVASNDADEEDD